MPERRERLAETDCGVNGRMPRWTEEERVASSAVASSVVASSAVRVVAGSRSRKSYGRRETVCVKR